jgi:Ribosomal protein L11 methyltransferase (PrmA)
MEERLGRARLSVAAGSDDAGRACSMTRDERAIPLIKQLNEFAPDFCAPVTRREKQIEEYGRFQQHVGLIEDGARVRAFCDAIGRSKGRGVVVDVGAGSGLLGVIALKCGYDRAILVEPSRKMCAYAEHLASLNGVRDRVTIVNSTLETVPSTVWPRSLDLIVTETISALIFGFTSWEALPALVKRLGPDGTIIPRSGRVFAALAERDYSTRSGASSGFGFLESLGVRIDLAARTFRSGGNVYDKAEVLADIRDGRLTPAPIAAFDFAKSAPFSMDGGRLLTSAAPACGVVAFWEIELSAPESCVTITSIDPLLTSWCPFYIPFKEPLETMEPSLLVRLEFRKVDAPYDNAFQLCGESGPLTHTLFW